MATVVHPYRERRTGERRRLAYPATFFGAEGTRVSWGGILGGVLVALGLLFLLTALGVAIGITAVDPARTEAAKLGAGAGIWAGAALLVALFVGGLVSTRIGATHDGTTAFFSGFLVWVVSVLLMAYLAASGASSVAGGAFSLFASQPRQVQEQAAGSLMQKAEELQQKAPQLQQKAQEMKPQATKAAWIAFAGLLLSLFAAVIGAALGRRRAAVHRSSTGT